MIFTLKDAKHISGYVIWLKFDDGVEGEIDLQPELYGTVFESLKDPAFFVQFKLDPELRTLVWPNGADFSPEFLHESVRVTA